jgi:hypothetical protein
MIVTPYSTQPQILRRDNPLQTNANTLTPGVDADWNVPAFNTISNATTTGTTVTLPSGTYSLTTVTYYEGGNRSKLSIQYFDGTVGIGPLSAGGYTRTTGGGIETSNTLHHLLVVPVSTVITLSVRMIRVGAAGAVTNTANTSEWSIIRLGNAL